MEVVRDKKTTASSSVPLKTLTPWVYIQAIPSPSPLPKPLTDKEYQIMRNASIAVLREIGGRQVVQMSTSASIQKTGRMVAD